MPLYAGLYNYHNNEEARQKRAAVADQHVAFVEALMAQDAIVLATIRGDDDAPGGEIVVRAASKEAARELFSKDPNTSAELGNWKLTDFVPVAGSLMDTVAAAGES